jgi:hypothetical protein
MFRGWWSQPASGGPALGATPLGSPAVAAVVSRLFLRAATPPPLPITAPGILITTELMRYL